MNDPVPPMTPAEPAKLPFAEEIERNLYPKPEAQQPKPEPKIVFKGGERAKTVPLQFPFSVDAVDYSSITIKRLTAGEVSAFIDDLRAMGDKELKRFPIYHDERGDLVPDHVWDAMDDDDVQVLQSEAQAFLPKRFRQDPSATATPPETSSSTPSGSGTFASS